MLRHKNIDRVCCIVLAATLLLTCCFMGAAAMGVIAGERSMGYEKKLFDQSRVHTIDLVMDDWEGFLETCTEEEYAACTVVIDGENIGSAGIRGKGNTSLSSVKSYGNERYSFKIEFDQYQPGKTYHGLDKLSLNNLIQDKTYLKDYLAYTLMNKMGVAAPLCSFAQINVNGEPWGLYLAVEAVEDSFLSRNYGSDHGELYKPDSMSFGGGRGNGRDFDMDAFADQFENGVSEMSGTMKMPEESEPMQRRQMPDGQRSSERRTKGGEGFGARGSSDVMLQYTDDDPSSYSNIFNNAKTDITEADQQRLIDSLKKLSEGKGIEEAVDIEAVIRYLVVHNFLCNGDSYTGGMVHNYYLYEENGVLSMIPWDYNLAFGAFNMGGMGVGSGATSTVNSPIDSPVSSGEISSRPMISWIFESEEYTARYHELYAEFIAGVFGSGWMAEELDRLSQMLDPYVQAETRRFFSYEQFLSGAEALKAFCNLRAESISGQLDGSVPSTTEGQRENPGALVDASNIDLSDMGEFGMGGGRNGNSRGLKRNDVPTGAQKSADDMSQIPADSDADAVSAATAGGMPIPDGMPVMPAGMPAMPGGMQPPEEMAGIPRGQMEQFGEQSPQAIQQEVSDQDDSSEQGMVKPTTDENQSQDSGETTDMPQFSGERIPGIDGKETVEAGRTDNLSILLGYAALLLAAMLFVKFFKVNR